MNVVIVGGGEIGARICDELQLHHQHNITVLDVKQSVASSFDTMDVRFIQGSGSDPEDLRQAEVPHADAFIACTSSDEVNILSCLAAKGLGACQTLAFVTRERYVDAFTHQGIMESVGLVVDRIVWPQRTLAKQIVDIVRVPRALDAALLGSGKVKLVEYKLEEGDPFIGKPLGELELPESLLVVGSIRGESFVIPTGKTSLCPGDKVVFMGTVNSIRKLESLFARRKRHLRVTIVGGGNVGFMVAQELLNDRGTNITIIEQDRARCEKLAEYLPEVLVLEGDGTDLEILEQERIEDTDVLVTVTDNDSKNLLVALLGKHLKIPKVITRVGRGRNRRLFEKVGIDSLLTPRSVAVQEVLNWLKVDNIDHLASIEDLAEVMEVTYPYQCPVAMLKDLKTPPNSLIGAIIRKKQVIIPNGQTTVQHADHLLIVTPPHNVKAIHDWLDHPQPSPN